MLPINSCFQRDALLFGKKFFIVTLGCFRNEYESDLMRSLLAGGGLLEAPVPEEADIVIVNTCGFIAAACEESIDTILEVSERLGPGKRAPLLVAGCMAERYRGEILRELPEASGVLGTGWTRELMLAVRTLLSGEPYAGGFDSEGAVTPRRTVDSSHGPTLFVRIADGCNRNCSFCTIPTIRGALRSTPPEVVLEEIKRFTEGRQREVVLVAQDLTSYGEDLGGGVSLETLVPQIARVENVRWIRLLYLQPEGVRYGLLELMAAEPKVCRYLDLPFQHASTRVLRRMNRPGSAEEFLSLLKTARELMPDVAVRTTLMTGFPGEGERDFEELLHFVAEARFDWLGLFTFSREEGTAAFDFEDQVPGKAALERYNRILALQEEVEISKSEELIGRELEVLVEDESDLPGYLFRGRSYREAPGIDGCIYLRPRLPGVRAGKPGEFTKARITGLEGFDPVGEI